MAGRLSRRDFIRGSAVAAAALAAELGAAKDKIGPGREKVDTRSILYNPDMEYRRCGKTGLMISAVALGDIGNGW